MLSHGTIPEPVFFEIHFTNKPRSDWVQGVLVVKKYIRPQAGACALFFRTFLLLPILFAGAPLFGQADEPLAGQPGATIQVEVEDLFDFAPTVLIQPTQGNIPVELTPQGAPLTVSNFLAYADAGRYENSLIHRSARLGDGTPFVIQGGGFFFDFSGETTSIAPVPTFDAVLNEPNVSNTRGTIAMAKLGGDPDSATSQWFFNLSDNGPILDDQNGGFTVFGRVVGDGMEVVDAIANLSRFNLTQDFGSAFGEVPWRCRLL